MASQGVVEILLKAQDQASGAIGRVKGALVGLTASIAGAVLVIKNLVGAYNTQQVAQTKLVTAMRNLGDSSNATIESLNAQAASLQRLTGVSDDSITNSQALLATFGLQASQIKSLIPGILDLAAAKASLTGSEVDLNGASMAVAKAMENGLGILSRYGVTTSDAQKRSFELASTQERLAMLQDILKDKFGGMSEALGATFKGRVSALAQAWDDMKEIGGELLARVLNPLVNIALALSDKFRALNPETQKFLVGMALALGSLGTIVATIGSGMLVWTALGTAITGVATALTSAAIPAALLAGKIILIAGAAIALGTALYAVIQYTTGAQSQFNSLGKTITDSFIVPIKLVMDAFKFLWTVVSNTVTAITDSFIGLANAIALAAQGKFAEAGRAMGSFKDISVENITGIGAAWDEFTRSFITRGYDMGATQTQAFNDMGGMMKTTMDSIQGWWSQMNAGMDANTKASLEVRKVAHLSAFQQIVNGFKNMTDTQRSQLTNWNNFMLSSLQGATGKAKVVYKAFAITQAIADTYKAATGAYSSLVSLPIVGPVLAPIAAAAAIAAGMSNVNKIRALETGGIVPGSHSGQVVRVGEGGKSEAVIPLQNGSDNGLGGVTFIFNGPVLDHDKLMEMVDLGMSERARRGRSSFVQRIESGN